MLIMVFGFSGIAGTTDGQIGINAFDPVTYESVFLCGDATGVVEIERRLEQLLYAHHKQ